MSVYFGRAVACTRIERGWTRYELVEKAGISYSYLHNIESGAESPSLKMATRLAAALGVTPSALIARGDRIEAEEKAGWPSGWPARTGSIATMEPWRGGETDG
jgi:transcriptional regulator with XRE-family HTH domain